MLTVKITTYPLTGGPPMAQWTESFATNEPAGALPHVAATCCIVVVEDFNGRSTLAVRPVAATVLTPPQVPTHNLPVVYAPLVGVARRMRRKREVG